MNTAYTYHLTSRRFTHRTHEFLTAFSVPPLCLSSDFFPAHPIDSLHDATTVEQGRHRRLIDNGHLWRILPYGRSTRRHLLFFRPVSPISLHLGAARIAISQACRPPLVFLIKDEEADVVEATSTTKAATAVAAAAAPLLKTRTPVTCLLPTHFYQPLYPRRTPLYLFGPSRPLTA